MDAILWTNEKQEIFLDILLFSISFPSLVSRLLDYNYKLCLTLVTFSYFGEYKFFMNQNITPLNAMKEFLQETVKANYYLSFDDLYPETIIREIQTQLAENHFQWIDNTIYVPNLLIILAPASNPDKIEELEVIFNSVVFIKYLYEYMTEMGYKLFDFVKIDIETLETIKETNLKFYWPSPEEVREDFTVLLNKPEGKILQVFAPQAEIPSLARLSALNGDPYRSDYLITKQTTYLGRLRNVTDRETSHMIRRNDFIFARHPDPESVNSSVSRLHAKIVYEEGNFILYDTGSANGTSITRQEEIIELPRAEITGQNLLDNDLILLGSAQIKFTLVSNEEAANLVTMPQERSSFEESEYLEENTKSVDDTFNMSRKEIKAALKDMQDKK